MSVDKNILRKQVEFYLSDFNLTTDVFFREKVSADEEVKYTHYNFKQGWLDISYIMNCNKIK